MSQVKVPSAGSAITMVNNVLKVPDNPIIPFIEGDGIGPDIWSASQEVLDTAVKKAYQGEKRLSGLRYMLGIKLTMFMVLIRGCLKKL